MGTPRPQSAVTGLTTPSKLSNGFVDASDSAMRMSFYSVKNTKEGELINDFNVKNVVDLSKDDLDKIKMIREYMNEQAEGLRQEVE